MVRSTNTSTTRKRRKKILKSAKGYFGSKHKLFKTAKEQLMRSLRYSHRDRKKRARDFRRLWITRLNNACRSKGIKYSEFIHSLNHLKEGPIKLDRKQLSQMAISWPKEFDKLIEEIKKSYQFNPLVIRSDLI